MDDKTVRELSEGIALGLMENKEHLGQGDQTQAITFAISSALAPYVPSDLADKISTGLAPVVNDGIQKLKGLADEELKTYVPMFAAIVGGLMGLSVLLGVYVAKRKTR